MKTTVNSSWSILNIEATSDAIPTLFKFEAQPSTWRFTLFLSKNEAKRVLSEAYSTIELEMKRKLVNVRVINLEDSYLYDVDNLMRTQGLAGVQVKDGKPVYACWYLPWPGQEMMSLGDEWKGYQVHLREDGELTYTIYKQAMPGGEEK